MSPILALLLAGLGCGGGDRAGGYPARPLKVVVPFAPGGSTDTLTRIFKKAIDDEGLLPYPLVVLNIEGAGGSIGSRRVKNAPPNGYTLLSLHEALMTGRYAGTTVYGPEAFEPVAATGAGGLVVVAGQNSPYSNLAAVMQAAQQKPLIFGTNLGAVAHFVGLMLEGSHPGVRFRFVQTGGGAKRFSALIGGHLDLTAFSIDEYVRFREAGVRGLAYLGERRHPSVPELETAREAGFDVVFNSTQYWWMPKGTPADRIDRLAAALERAMSSPYVRQKLDEMQLEPVFLKGQELRRQIEDTDRRIAAVSLRPSLELPFLPPVVALLIGGLLLLTVRQEWQARRGSAPSSFDGQSSPPTVQDPPDSSSRIPTGNRRVALLSLPLIGAYVGVMAAEWLGFRAATVLFVVAAGLLISPQPRRHFWRVAALALILAVSLHAVFSRFLTVDLP